MYVWIAPEISKEAELPDEDTNRWVSLVPDPEDQTQKMYKTCPSCIA